MSSGISSLSDLHEDPKNPRVISDRAAGGLLTSLVEFGDLSGIVFNIRTGQLVAGHQRTDRLRTTYGDLPIIDGKITTPKGDVYNVRFVDWPLEKQRAANVAANSKAISGEFTDELPNLLAEIEGDNFELYSELLLGDLLSGGSGVDLAKEDLEEFDADSTAMPDLPSGDKEPISQMSFTLSDSEKELVQLAIDKAKNAGPFLDSTHTNDNGHALARLAEAYLG